MIRKEMSQEEINQVSRKNLMEPLTAVFNIGLAFVGPLAWTLAWFLLPPLFIQILKRRNKG